METLSLNAETHIFECNMEKGSLPVRDEDVCHIAVSKPQPTWLNNTKAKQLAGPGCKFGAKFNFFGPGKENFKCKIN